MSEIDDAPGQKYVSTGSITVTIMGEGGTVAIETSDEDQPLVAPKVRPDTKCFCNAK
ncbi:hypothetical protein KEM60_02278 [Austwickia sp. TVS 96-490-7B]|nr:hypothetical protein [Austwickia sp. TVS 96-490-7B]